MSLAGKTSPRRIAMTCSACEVERGLGGSPVKIPSRGRNFNCETVRQRNPTTNLRGTHYRQSGAKYKPFQKQNTHDRHTEQINPGPGKMETNSAEEFPWESMAQGGDGAHLFPASRPAQQGKSYHFLFEWDPVSNAYNSSKLFYLERFPWKRHQPIALVQDYFHGKFGPILQSTATKPPRH